MVNFTLFNLLNQFDTGQRKNHGYVVQYLEKKITEVSQGAMNQEAIRKLARNLARILQQKITTPRWKKKSWLDFTNDPAEKAWLDSVVLTVDVENEPEPDPEQQLVLAAPPEDPAPPSTLPASDIRPASQPRLVNPAKILRSLNLHIYRHDDSGIHRSDSGGAEASPPPPASHDQQQQQQDERQKQGALVKGGSQGPRNRSLRPTAGGDSPWSRSESESETEDRRTSYLRHQMRGGVVHRGRGGQVRRDQVRRPVQGLQVGFRGLMGPAHRLHKRGGQGGRKMDPGSPPREKPDEEEGHNDAILGDEEGAGSTSFSPASLNLPSFGLSSLSPAVEPEFVVPRSRAKLRAGAKRTAQQGGGSVAGTATRRKRNDRLDDNPGYSHPLIWFHTPALAEPENKRRRISQEESYEEENNAQEKKNGEDSSEDSDDDKESAAEDSTDADDEEDSSDEDDQDIRKGHKESRKAGVARKLMWKEAAQNRANLGRETAIKVPGDEDFLPPGAKQGSARGPGRRSFVSLKLRYELIM